MGQRQSLASRFATVFLGAIFFFDIGHHAMKGPAERLQPELIGAVLGVDMVALMLRCNISFSGATTHALQTQLDRSVSEPVLRP
jgi:hypothetical protein